MGKDDKVDRFAVSKKNSKMCIVDTVTEEPVYYVPSFIKLQSRGDMAELVLKSSMIGRVDIELIMQFERKMRETGRYITL